MAWSGKQAAPWRVGRDGHLARHCIANGARVAWVEYHAACPPPRWLWRTSDNAGWCASELAATEEADAQLEAAGWEVQRAPLLWVDENPQSIQIRAEAAMLQWDALVREARP